jgi:hypothetical protein
MKAPGIALIIAGILMLIFCGFSFTKEEKVIDVGPLEVNKKENKTIGWPVYAGGIAVAADVIILIAGRKKYETIYSCNSRFSTAPLIIQRRNKK